MTQDMTEEQEHEVVRKIVTEGIEYNTFKKKFARFWKKLKVFFDYAFVFLFIAFIISFIFFMIYMSINGDLYLSKTTSGTVRYGVQGENPFEPVKTNVVTVLDEKKGYISYINERGVNDSTRKGYFLYCYPNVKKGTGKPVFWEKEYWVKEKK